MSGIADVRADLAEVQRAAGRAHAALTRARVACPSRMRPVRGLENVTRIAAGAAATLFVAVVVHMANYS